MSESKNNRKSVDGGGSPGSAGGMEVARRALESARRVLLATHVHPDGDALGSQLALGSILRRLGKEVVLAGERKIGGSLEFLSAQAAQREANPSGQGPYDLIVALDAASRDRLPEPVVALADRETPVLNLDHHASNDRFGELNWVDPKAAATAEMLCSLSMNRGWDVSVEAAECLWVGLVTDSGRFGYEQTRPETLDAAAWLLRKGVNSAEMNERLYGPMPLKVFNLRRRMLTSLRMTGKGRAIVAFLRKEDFDATGSTPEDLEDILDWPRAVEGVEIVALLYEAGEKNTVRLSMRTDPPWDASRFCAGLDGGGHPRAAGATLGMPLDEAVTKIVALVSEWLQTGDADASGAGARLRTPEAEPLSPE